MTDKIVENLQHIINNRANLKEFENGYQTIKFDDSFNHAFGTKIIKGLKYEAFFQFHFDINLITDVECQDIDVIRDNLELIKIPKWIINNFPENLEFEVVAVKIVNKFVYCQFENVE